MKIINKMFFALTFLMAIVINSAPANAHLITYNFRGTVTTSDPSLAKIIGVNDLLSGSFTFESNTAPRAGGSSLSMAFAAVKALNFTVGGYAANSVGNPEVRLGNHNGEGNIPTHTYEITTNVDTGINGADIGSNAIESFSLGLYADIRDLNSNPLSLSSQLILSRFRGTAFNISFIDSDGTWKIVQGKIDSLVLVPPGR